LPAQASRRSPHPAQYASLRNIEAEHRQLAVDAWSIPGRILGNGQKQQIAAADVSASRPQAVAEALGFPKAGRDASKRAELPK